jgi:hypothetical protein
MGFQLTIAEGTEAGREFIFQQQSVTIGRTSDCDVILYDPGISRKHARIFSEGDTYAVEDLGSSNGTKVNGSLVKRQTLKDGDAVSLGPVSFNFATIVYGEENTDVVHQDGTRIVSRTGLAKRGAEDKSALLGDDLDPSQAQKLRRRDTQTVAAVGKPRPSVTVRPSGDRLSAAERARMRREASGVFDNAKVAWAEASEQRRRAWILVAGVGALLAIALAVWVLWPTQVAKVKLPPEPDLLTRKPIRYSFGVGDDVDYDRPDSKLFKFELNSPVRAVAVLHYQSKDASDGEVMISVNGAGVDVVPPDTLNASEVAHQVVISFKHLKRGETNEVLFDNTLFPPNRSPWRVWNVWMETLLVPEVSPEQSLQEAQNIFQRGQLNYERRGIGARNLYESWRDFRLAWISLEAHPDPKPELYRIARDKEQAALAELDQLCNRLMLEAIGHFNQKNEEAATYTLEHVQDYFPGYDHPCAFRAELKRNELRL